MNISSRWGRLLGICAVLLGGQVFADEVDEQVSEHVASLRKETKDPATLAGRIVEVARTVSDAPLRARLCEEAYTVGLASRKRHGLAAAAQAARLAIETDPNNRSDWYRRLIRVLRVQFAGARGRAAAEIKAQVARVLDQQAAWKEIDKYRARLQADNTDRAALKKLAELYVTALDQPSEAAKLLDDTFDAEFRSNVALAMKTPGELSEADRLKLGCWYYAFARQGPAPGTVAMLRRARACFRWFVKFHTDEDADLLKARTDLLACERALARLTCPKPIDLLSLVDIETHAIQGHWERNRGALLTMLKDHEERGHSMLLLPVVPDGSYEIRAKMTTQFGRIYLLLPVQDRMCAAAISRWSLGISQIDGLPADNERNPTTKKVNVSARSLAVLIRVIVNPCTEQANLVVAVNGVEHINWTGAWELLSCHVSTPGNTLGISVSLSRGYSVTLRSMTLRMLAGEARITGLTSTE